MDMELYARIVKFLETQKEDIRFNRELKLKEIFGFAKEIAEIVGSNFNLLSAINRIKLESYEYEAAHPVNVAVISATIGKWLCLPETDIFQLAYTGLIHDIGKFKVSDSILYKKDALNEAEMKMMREHPVKGYNYLLAYEEISDACKEAVLYHHERSDGSGYPEGIAADEIPLYARIIAIADIFDAMTSQRVYAEKSTLVSARTEIAAGAFQSLDPKISQLFYKRISESSIGAQCVMDNGVIGQIVYVSPLYPYEPLIKHDNGYYDMVTETGVKVVEIM